MTDESDGSSLPIVDDNALTGHHGEAAVNLAVTKLGFIFRDQTKLDFGIDGTPVAWSRLSLAKKR